MGTITKSIKKLSKVGEGVAVFLSQEVKKLGWAQGEYVSVEAVDDGREQKLILKRIKL